MSEKTRAELKEQIKIMNRNYQTIKEMHERGYQYFVGEVKRLQDELERTRKALDAALDKLKRIQKIYTNAPFNAPINYANVCTDMYDVATEQIKELDNE